MLKSTVGIIIKRTDDYWIVRLVRLCDSSGKHKEDICVTLYFDDFKCDVWSLNRSIKITDAVKFSYKKKLINNRLKIIVFDAVIIPTNIVTGYLCENEISGRSYPVIKDLKLCEQNDGNSIKESFYIIKNMDPVQLSSMCCGVIVAKYIILDDQDNCYTNIAVVHISEKLCTKPTDCSSADDTDQSSDSSDESTKRSSDTSVSVHSSTNNRTICMSGKISGRCCDVPMSCDIPKLKEFCSNESTCTKWLKIIRLFLILQFIYLFIKYVFYVLCCS